MLLIGNRNAPSVGFSQMIFNNTVPPGGIPATAGSDSSPEGGASEVGVTLKGTQPAA